jgi:hypothetical protein
LLSCLALLLVLQPGRAAEPPVSFNRDVRPILADNCFACHGPDQARRKANLRLDTEEGTFAERKGSRAVVPGSLDKSELYRRITAEDENERMPPPTSGKRLNPGQIDLLRRWIEQGAKWEKHWAFLPPQRPEVPAVKDEKWVRNPIDAFVLARLEREGLGPSPEAEKATLIRRVSLDLTGLPPTPAEVDVFLADTSPDAYEKVVDRLLRSPRYGERMAYRWMEAARYADTNGYQGDGERVMWRWRDWVIEAYNKNLPFDRFTVEQLAGDLLPGATLEQKIATGFNRNHRGNGEGGIIPEEYAVEYVVDRVDTTATVWLGLTMGCARCHDHKYDPIRQREYYQVFAFFNNIPEKGRVNKYGNSPPMIPSPTREQQDRLKRLKDGLAAADADFDRMGPRRSAAQRQWEQSLKDAPRLDWAPTRAQTDQFELTGDTANQAAPERRAKFVGGDPAYAPGPHGQAAELDGKRYLDAGDVGGYGYLQKFSLAGRVYLKGDRGGMILSRMADVPRGTGYGLKVEGGKLRALFTNRWLDDAMRVETEDALTPECWHHVVMTYDGSRTAKGVKAYLDGRPAGLKVLLDELNQEFKTSQPFLIGAGDGADGRFHGLIRDVRVYDRVVTPDEAGILANADSVSAIAAIAPEKRSPAQAHKIEECFLDKYAPEDVRAAQEKVVQLRVKTEKLIDTFPTTMVMEEMPAPRDTFVLLRGAYDKRGEKVAPGVPEVVFPWPRGVKADRLGFARWVADPGNPLTARVAANRLWQMLFGHGLVRTVDDFGAQGEAPTHPELLDWLATEFVRTGWDQKALLKTIVTSATYRQSSRVAPVLLQKDPENRLLARGPRSRLSAEMIRDQALAVSGLLREKVGGPSVRPYQPPGLLKDLTGSEDYPQSHGDDLYRRSLYTFWKRTVAPPLMMTFDAAGRETCVVRETRTNTPLQALTLMNDVSFVEAARALAQRVIKEGGATPEQRLAFAFRLATDRPPRVAERKVLLDGFEQHLSRFRKEKGEALKLVSVGEYRRDEGLDVGELAAYTAVASLILNLDEVITKE